MKLLRRVRNIVKLTWLFHEKFCHYLNTKFCLKKISRKRFWNYSSRTICSIELCLIPKLKMLPILHLEMFIMNLEVYVMNF